MIVTVLVARSTTIVEFGAFSLAMSAYLLVTVAVRGITAEPLTIRFSTAETSSWRKAASSAAACAFAMGFAVGVVIMAIGFCIPGIAGSTLVMIGLVMPGLTAQDTLRFAALSNGRPSAALINDAMQFVMQCAGIAGLLTLGLGTAPLFVLVWGLGAAFASIGSCVQLQLAPKPSLTRDWLKDHGRLGSTLLLDNLVNQGSAQVAAFTLALTTGLRDVGAFRAVQTAFKPVAVLGLGVRVALVPELVRSRASSNGRLHRDVLRLGCALGLVALAWSFVLVLAPDSFGHALLGDSWDGAASLVLVFAVAQVAASTKFGPEAGLRALEQGRSILRTRIVVSVLVIALQTLGAALFGAMGVVTAVAILRPLEAVLWWIIFRNAAIE